MCSDFTESTNKDVCSDFTKQITILLNQQIKI